MKLFLNLLILCSLFLYFCECTNYGKIESWLWRWIMTPIEEGFTPSPEFIANNPNYTLPDMYDIDTNSVNKNKLKPNQNETTEKHVEKYFASKVSTAGSSFLTNGLFSKTSKQQGLSGSVLWSDEKDREWRSTTKAPYFENKQPGSESVLPAAAVIGAATAFGVYSLLPLNVPSGKAVLSCNSTELQQAKINFNGTTYGCFNKVITINTGTTLECDKKKDSSIIYCTNGTLIIMENIFCNDTTFIDETNTNVLHCFSGLLPDKIASSIPVEDPIEIPKKPVTTGQQVKVFLLWWLGKSNKTTTEATTPHPNQFYPHFLNETDTLALITSRIVKENIQQQLNPIISQTQLPLSFADVVKRNRTTSRPLI
ncbi:unnamed protein product [Diamesa serratosioi]